jgi:hypothetical protein
MNRYYDVIIASPGINFSNYYIWSLVDTLNELNEKNISYYWCNDYSSHVGQARQRIIDNLKKIKSKKIFWIDSDIEWATEDFMKIYESDFPITSGCYLSTTGEIAAHREDGSHLMPHDLNNKIITVKSCGLGFVCMDYDLMLSVANPFIPVDDIHNEDEALFKRIGIPVHLDSSVKLIHHKTVPLVI